MESDQLRPEEIQICHHKQAPWISPCGCHTCSWCDTPVHMGQRWCEGCKQKIAERDVQ